MLVIFNDKSMAKKMITPKTQRLKVKISFTVKKIQKKENVFNSFYINYQFSKASSKQTVFL